MPAITEPQSLAGMWADYTPIQGGYDETRSAEGVVHAYWASFIETVAHLTLDDLARLQQTATQHIAEHGASFDMHSGRDGTARPWRLDPIPLLIDHDEWLVIDAGLQQRARLLSKVLADLYGPQTLLRSGRLSPDLVLRHRGFQYPCMHSLGEGRQSLHYYAADLARGPDGRMWVINDRTGIPPGAGYALENRTILAQLFPEEIRRLQVHRVSGYFRALRSGLYAAAPHPETGGRVVFYTPGPYSPSYFEHAYLAAYLGYTLVQGDDLVVRDGRLWLKALEGLQAVDVVIRRVNDAYCDPLELAEDSLLGVPGLLEAARQGEVAIVNPIGSNVLENPGLIPFLPSLAEELLEEELILPTAATWWCGQPRERNYVIDHLDELVVKPTDRQPGQTTLEPYRMCGNERDQLIAAIREEPWRYIGQERVSFSTMPVLEGNRLEPRAVTLRAFTHYDGHSFHTLPGGLTRCGASGQTYLSSGLLGGTCKDTWILTPEPVAYQSLWLERRAEDQRNPLTGFFTSHAVEDLFWTGRYAERAACILQTTRVLLEHYDQIRASHGDAHRRCAEILWQGLIQLTGFSAAEPEERPTEPSFAHLARWATDPNAEGGLLSVLRRFSSAAFSVRENWSEDTWRIIHRLHEQAERPIDRAPQTLDMLQKQLSETQLLLQGFSGLCHESMTRTAGWLFLNIGRRLERGIMMVDLLTATLDLYTDEPTDYYLLEALLATHESLITYRRSYRTTPQRSEVLGLLLLQAKNPRSLRFLLQLLVTQLHALAEEIESEPTGLLHTPIAGIEDTLASICPSTLAQPDPTSGRFVTLQEALHPVRACLCQTSDRISHIHFNHVTPRALPLTSVRPPDSEASPR